MILAPYPLAFSCRSTFKRDLLVHLLHQHNVSSVPVSALNNALLETEISCYRIQNQLHVILLRSAEIWHFHRTLSWGYFFTAGHSVVLMDIACSLQMRDMNHENVNHFIGLCTEAPNISILKAFCSRGSLMVGNAITCLLYTSPSPRDS